MSISMESMEVVNRPMATTDIEAIGGRDRGADPGLGAPHGQFQIIALGKAGRDGRG
jgi:hypothetical protein